MTLDALVLLVPVAVTLAVGAIAARLTARQRRMRPAWRMALGLFAASVAIFAVVINGPWTDQQDLPGVLVAFFILTPAALGAILGGILGRVFGR